MIPRGTEATSLVTTFSSLTQPSQPNGGLALASEGIPSALYMGDVAAGVWARVVGRGM